MLKDLKFVDYLRIISGSLAGTKQYWASVEIGIRSRLKIVWPKGREGSSPSSPTTLKTCGFSSMTTRQKQALAYIVGVALGDGNLSNPNGRAVRLRVTCDTSYPLLIKHIQKELSILLPKNKISIVPRTKSYLDVSCYSNLFEEWLGWQAGAGPKHKQLVLIPSWIKRSKVYTRLCLRGLFETDGSVYYDRGYLMANFTTIISTLSRDVVDMIHSLGFISHTYTTIYATTNQHPKFVTRISKNSQLFIKAISLKKQ